MEVAEASVPTEAGVVVLLPEEQVVIKDKIIMDIIIGFFKSKHFSRFLWYLGDSFLGLWVIYLTEVDWYYAPLAIAIIESVTKFLNKKRN
jgi:hypothetical protein